MQVILLTCSMEQTVPWPSLVPVENGSVERGERGPAGAGWAQRACSLEPGSRNGISLSCLSSWENLTGFHPDPKAEWFPDSLVYVSHAEADFSTIRLPWFLLGPAEPCVVAVQVEDACQAKPLLEYLQLSSVSACVEVYLTFLIKLVLEIVVLGFLNLHEAVIGFLFCRDLRLSQED